MSEDDWNVSDDDRFGGSDWSSDDDTYTEETPETAEERKKRQEARAKHKAELLQRIKNKEHIGRLGWEDGEDKDVTAALDEMREEAFRKADKEREEWYTKEAARIMDAKKKGIRLQYPEGTGAYHEYVILRTAEEYAKKRKSAIPQL